MRQDKELGSRFDPARIEVCPQVLKEIWSVMPVSALVLCILATGASSGLINEERGTYAKEATCSEIDTSSPKILLDRVNLLITKNNVGDVKAIEKAFSNVFGPVNRESDGGSFYEMPGQEPLVERVKLQIDGRQDALSFYDSTMTQPRFRAILMILIKYSGVCHPFTVSDISKYLLKSDRDYPVRVNGSHVMVGGVARRYPAASSGDHDIYVSWEYVATTGNIVGITIYQ